VLEDSLRKTTVLKLNDAEVPEVLRLLRPEGHGFGVGSTPDTHALLDGAHTLLSEFDLQLVCVTMGGRGSLLVARETFDEHPGVPVQVADTIGAGDAFTAALTSYYLKGAPLPVLNEAGNRWGSWVASQSGAMPPLPEEVRARIEREIAAGRAWDRTR
jgi:fructokinase